MMKKILIITASILLLLGIVAFLFVDFGSLFPNKIELNNNIQAFPFESGAYSNTFLEEDKQNLVSIVFVNNNSNDLLISSVGNFIESETFGICKSFQLRNIDSGELIGCENINYDLIDTDLNCKNETIFKIGEVGLLNFKCSENPGLINGEVLKGDIKVNLKDFNSGNLLTSQGDLRITISE